ncbi:MAG: cold shock and DUF1294 domain-containing protein [Acidobacteriota bacterium]
MAKATGTLTTWNDDKGYGFIAPQGGGQEVFVHISDVHRRTRRPQEGDRVTYQLTTDDRGRPRAQGATLAGATSAPRQPRSQQQKPREQRTQQRKPRRRGGAPKRAPLLVVGGAIAAAALAVEFGALPKIYLLLVVGLSLVTFVAYAIDKSAAQEGGWRTPEQTLHLLALAGGWPGALLAQTLLRHKTRKQPFRIVFWLTVVIHCLAVGSWFIPAGREWWQSML